MLEHLLFVGHVEMPTTNGWISITSGIEFNTKFINIKCESYIIKQENK